MTLSSSVNTVDAALRHRYLLLVGIVAVFLAAGAGLSVLMPRTYEARATLYLASPSTATDFDTAFQATELQSRNLTQAARSRPVLDQVIARLKQTNPTPPSAEALASRVRVTGLRGTSLLAVTAEASSPSQAADTANAVAESLIAQNKADVTARLGPTEARLDKEITGLDAAIKQETEAMRIPPTPENSAAISAHQAQLAVLQSQYQSTFTRRQDVLVQHDRLANAVLLSERAVPNWRPIQPDPPLYMLVALAAGLVIGLLAALVAERLDDRILSAEVLAEVTGSPLVAEVAGGKALANGSYSVGMASLDSRLAGLRSVMVAAASARDHTETVAARLGQAASRRGRRVLLVQAGVPGPTTAGQPSPNGSGLTTIRLTQEETSQVAQTFAQHAAQYDLAILAVPSPGVSQEAAMLAKSADCAVLVSTLRVTTRTEARLAAAALRQVGVEPFASILLGKRTGFAFQPPAHRPPVDGPAQQNGDAGR
jgi:capsular polysaccharide biosynthesis protein